MMVEIFKAPNNDGSGRVGWHVSVEGEAGRSGVWGGFRTRQQAERVAQQRRGEPYWDDLSVEHW